MHEKFMQRAIELARLGSGKVLTNPLVGCVIVHNDLIIGEGWHKEYGDNHAEVNAIASVKNKALLPESTLYVTLEPCCHVGKTPPCADLIIKSGIKQVVIALEDPFHLVAGKGIEHLIQNGVSITLGICANEAKDLIVKFTTYHTQKRPYVILKWAQTINGFLSPDASKVAAEVFEEKRHITGKVVQTLVHKLRTYEDAIFVGTNTASFDNPALNARQYPGKSPLRIVIDKELRLPKNLKLFDQSQPTLVLTSKVKQNQPNLNYLTLDFSKDWFKPFLDYLYEAKICSLIVEGGNILLSYFLSNKFFDEALVLTSLKSLEDGIESPKIRAELVAQETIDSVIISKYKNDFSNT